MLSKIIAWVLAALTALLSNLGFWIQPDSTYKGDPGYVVEGDVVNYKDVQDWYAGAMIGDNTCNVTAKHHSMEANTFGCVFIVAGAPMNPDAKLVFSDEDVIVAPSRGRIMTQPSTSPNKIIVQNDEVGNMAYKMIIYNPKRWFCCEDIKPGVTGSFKHKQVDHRITLNQGDTICVASSNTTIELFVGDATTGTLKKATLREFLHASDKDKNVNSDPSKNLNGSATQQLTNTPDKDSLKGSVRIPNELLFTGPSGWKKAADNIRWWWGELGKAGKSYPADQYVIYDGDYYFFDSGGYMVTGWGKDGYYYYPDAKAYEEQRSSFKQGALCYDTMVPDKGNSNDFVYVNREGKVDMENPESAMAAAGTTYVFNKDIGKYQVSAGYSTDGKGHDDSDEPDNSDKDADVQDDTNDDNENNPGAPDIDNQKGDKKELTSGEWSTLTKDGGYLGENRNGWHSYKGNWVHLTEGQPTDSEDKYTYTIGKKEAYGCSIDGKYYLFDSDSYIMIKGHHSGETPVKAAYEGSHGTQYVIVVGDRGLAQNEWYKDNSGRWMYADKYGVLLCGQVNADEAIAHINPSPSSGLPEDSNNYWFAFDKNCYLDMSTPTVYVTIFDGRGRQAYTLDTNLTTKYAGSRIRSNP